MVDARHLALIHAEIDGELDGAGRAELASLVLADPELRARRDGLKRLCASLDATETVEPPPELRTAILAALPQASPRAPAAWRMPAFRYAALIAFATVAGALFFAVDRPGTRATDAAGTLIASPATLDSVALHGAVGGRATLFRDAQGFGVDLDVRSEAPLEVRIARGGETLAVTAFDQPAASGRRIRIPLPEALAGGEPVEVTVLIKGLEVGAATLSVPPGR